MTNQDTANQKSALREQILQARADEKPGHFCEDAHDETLVLWLADNGYRKIAAYIAMEDEPNTELLLEVCTEVGIEVLVPRVAGERLEWVRFDWDDLEVGAFGIPEPQGEAVPLNVEAMIIPALAASHDGVRLGRGKGFYDRALKTVGENIPVVALVHDGELFEELPSEEHDRGVTWVSTCSALLEVES